MTTSHRGWCVDGGGGRDGALVVSLDGDETRAYVAAARAARPELELEEPAFSRYVAGRWSDGQSPPREHAGDLLLAWACGRGAPAAMAAFRRDYQPIIARVLGRRRAIADLADDVTQTVYERLLLAR